MDLPLNIIDQLRKYIDVSSTGVKFVRPPRGQ